MTQGAARQTVLRGAGSPGTR